MVMMTRSVASSKKKKEEKKKITVNTEKPTPPPKEEPEPEIEEEDDFFENDYTIPTTFTGNEKLTKMHETIVESIQNDDPDLEKILTSKIRFKRKKEIFEWYYIYRYSFPNSEDRHLLKKEICDKLDQYKEEYKEFVKNKEKFKEMEKLEKKSNDLTILRQKLLSMDIDSENQNILMMKLFELQNREYKDEEYYKLFHWFKSALDLPFNKIIPLDYQKTSDLFQKMKTKLDEYLYGMDKVKEQIMLYVHNKIQFPFSCTQPLGLVGPPGVGKTSIALAVSSILNIPFAQISMGGVTNSDFIKGHDYTFVGSKSGEIAQSLIKLKCKNGIIFLDEFDKICESKDIVNSLLHIFDTSQNNRFQDNFFGNLRLDLSNIWFVCSMNEIPTNEKALSDRIFFIEVPGYTVKDKQSIVKNYILPKSLKNLRMESTDIVLSDDIVMEIINYIDSDESGIRLLKQAIETMISKVAFLKSCQDNVQVSFELPKKYYPITFPFHIRSDIVPILLKDFNRKTNPSIQYMYV